MRSFVVKTGAGKTRTVWAVTGREQRAYVRLAQKLAIFERSLATRHGVADVAHGFVAGRSPVTMATAHIGYDVTVSMDMADWFGTVRVDQLLGCYLRLDWAERCCPGGLLRQGLPTSPAAANIAAVALDELIVKERDEMDWPIIYTRYADDMTFSWQFARLPRECDGFQTVIQRHVAKMGWRLNEGKTRIQYASAGRRIICGLSVGETDVRATRSVRHRLRACQHARPDEPQTRGLAEWAACKLPGHRVAAAGVTRTLSRGD